MHVWQSSWLILAGSLQILRGLERRNVGCCWSSPVGRSWSVSHGNALRELPCPSACPLGLMSTLGGTKHMTRLQPWAIRGGRGGTHQRCGLSSAPRCRLIVTVWQLGIGLSFAPCSGLVVNAGKGQSMAPLCQIHRVNRWSRDPHHVGRKTNHRSSITPCRRLHWVEGPGTCHRSSSAPCDAPVSYRREDGWQVSSSFWEEHLWWQVGSCPFSTRS